MSSLNAQSWLSVPVPEDPMAKAQWIWAQPKGAPAPTVGGGAEGTFAFSKVVRSNGDERATLRFTADNSAKASINGVEVGRSADWSQVATIDLTGRLRPGDNELRITATNDAAAAASLNPGGLLACLEIEASGGKRKAILSDGTWAVEGGKAVALGPAGSAPWNLNFRPTVAPIFRREFAVARVPGKAAIEVVGLGHYHVFLNGVRLGSSAINQPWSQYDKTIYSQTFDLAPHLRVGQNVLAVMLGNGFYRVAQPPPGRACKGDAMPDYSEGEPVRLWVRGFVASDGDWRWTDGPLTLSHVYAGEDYDARLVHQGWMLPGFDDRRWRAPKVVRPPKGKVAKQFWPGLEAREAFAPVEIVRAPSGRWTYKFAQNCSAILRFRVRGPRGAVVKFQLSEVVRQDGEVEQLNLWNTTSLTCYTLAGSGVEAHENLFFYHGGQFVGVDGAVPAGKPNPEGLPVLESLELVHVRTDNRPASHFESSSELANRTVALIDWAMRSNMSWVMTDCPHREKLGWLECAHLLADSFAYRYDCRDWFRKICRDMRDAQLRSGRVLTVAPRFLKRPEDDAYHWTVEWGAASVLLPWQAYRWYGDRRFLSENLPMMRRFVDHVGATSKGLIAHGALGDWYDYGHGQPPGPSRYTDPRLTATAMFALCAQAVAKSAEALGDQTTARRYHDLRARIGEAFLREFYDPVAKVFANRGSVQTGSAMALAAGLVPPEDRDAVLAGIIRELEGRGHQQTSGDVGHLFFIRALARAGRSDVLHKVYARTGLGSYGGILAKGLTTLPETWDAITVGSNSLNHCMLGHAMEWYYGYVLGIRQAEGSVGWKRIVVDPVPGSLDWARGHLDTPQGRIEVDWRRSGAGMEIEFTVPRGARASCGGKDFGPGRHRARLG